VSDLAQTFADLVRFETRLYNVLGERLRADHGLTAGQFEFLRVIGGRDGCRVNDIAHEVAITIGATSKAVDRLEAAGWVRRKPNPADRRSSVLVLTAAGRRKLDAAGAGFDAVLREWLGDQLSARRLDQLGSALGSLRAAVESAGVGMPTG
jgi:MarR family transcriptional regulator, multiple antibiotic resistance protein MarR